MLTHLEDVIERQFLEVKPRERPLFGFERSRIAVRDIIALHPGSEEVRSHTTDWSGVQERRIDGGRAKHRHDLTVRTPAAGMRQGVGEHSDGRGCVDDGLRELLGMIRVELIDGFAEVRRYGPDEAAVVGGDHLGKRLDRRFVRGVVLVRVALYRCFASEGLVVSLRIRDRNLIGGLVLIGDQGCGALDIDGGLLGHGVLLVVGVLVVVLIREIGGQVHLLQVRFGRIADNSYELYHKY